MIAALYVDARGHYATLPDVDPWAAERDARWYSGPWPVVAHPPCNLWVNFAAVNWRRYGRQRPAWYPGGTDGGCFACALASVRAWGGVLEHPAGSHAWDAHGLPAPTGNGWSRTLAGLWVCEVWQSAYGHPARKRTWLAYSGERAPRALRWERSPGSHQIGWFDRLKPTVSKRAASATPPAFATELLALARESRPAPQQLAMGGAA